MYGMENCAQDDDGSKTKHLRPKQSDRSQEWCSTAGSINGKSVKISLPSQPDEKPNSLVEDDVFASKNQLLLSGEFLVPQNFKPYGRYAKIAVMVCFWVGCTFTLMVKNEKVMDKHQISVPKGHTRGYIIPEEPNHNQMTLRLEGAFLPKYYANLSTNWMNVWVELVLTKDNPSNLSSLDTKKVVGIKNVTELWIVPLVSEELIGVVPEVKHKIEFKLKPYSCKNSTYCFLNVKMKTNLEVNFPVSLGYNLEPINKHVGVIYAALILVFLYVLIIFEVIHKTLAAMMASTMSVAILAALNARPTMAEIVSWIDIETLLLLFSMMTLVAIFGETGIFDYLAVLAYKLTGGKIWPLVNTLCFFTALLSCFLDNVTTALLMTPVTIRLCEVMRLNPVPVLINMIIYSNIGGAVTPIGDPPNVIIASNAAVMESGVNFSLFTIHMGIGVLLAMVVVYFQLKFVYRDINALRYTEPNDVQDLRREIEVCRRAAASMGSYSKDEYAVKDSLMRRTITLVGQLNIRTSNKVSSLDNYSLNLKDLEAQYPIRDKVLLVKSGIALCFVITAFFLHSVPEISRLGLGWTALLGALLLLLLSGRDDVDAIFAKVEWSTLLFFASLFILMEALSRLGLIDWIGNQTHLAIMSVGQESRLAVAILIILWVSACASAFVDNIPLTTMMVKIVTTLADKSELGLPLQPLVWALSFGACLGGNGTLFGSSSNIVCAGVAEQHGYKFSFVGFMKTAIAGKFAVCQSVKAHVSGASQQCLVCAFSVAICLLLAIGFPIMLSSMCVVTVYLLLVHVVWCWH